MGVYIPTMIMPSDCDYCDFYQRGYCGAKGARVQCEEGVDADCPLVEVKTPHGRLIDADDFAKYIVRDIDYIPTVIEGETDV